MKNTWIELSKVRPLLNTRVILYSPKIGNPVVGFRVNGGYYIFVDDNVKYYLNNNGISEFTHWMSLKPGVTINQMLKMITNPE